MTHARYYIVFAQKRRNCAYDVAAGLMFTEILIVFTVDRLESGQVVLSIIIIVSY